MHEVEISGESIYWPQHCCVCEDNGTKILNIRCSITTNAVPIGIGFVTIENFLMLSSPICKKHFLKTWLATDLSKRNSFYLLLGAFSTICLISPLFYLLNQINNIRYGLEFDALSSGLIFGLLFPAVYWSIFLWARKNTPIKIKKFTKNSVTLIFNNEEYAQEFSALNTVMPNPPFKRDS